MVRVRFASAVSGVGARRFADEQGGALVLRIDDADAIEDLEWLGVRWDERPLRASDRHVRYVDAAHQIGTELLRPDSSPTPQLASAVDDVDFGITHVIHQGDDDVQSSLIRALGAEPPQSIRHGLLLGSSSLADLRDAGYPAEAVRTYLDELGLPSHDVQLDLPRLRRLSIEALAALSDDELAARVGLPVSAVPAMRGARDLREAREYALQVLEPVAADVDAPETLERFRELVEGGLDARGTVRELQAVGGNLEAVRLALTGRHRGPELAAVIQSLSRDELLSRLDRCGSTAR